MWQQWLEDISVKLLTDPLLRVINVSPNDGYTSGHCTFANYLAWDYPSGEKMEWSFGGGAKVILSDLLIVGGGNESTCAAAIQAARQRVKNIDVSSIAQSALRLHGQMMHVGQAAATLAWISLRDDLNHARSPPT